MVLVSFDKYKYHLYIICIYYIIYERKQTFFSNSFFFFFYHMTIATILRTASFRLWQKLTKALPFGPILPSIIPGHTEQSLKRLYLGVPVWDKMRTALTHSGRKYNNSKDIHSIACSFTGTYEHIRGRSQVKGEVLNVTSIIVLDTIDKCSPGVGLWQGLTHHWFGLHNVVTTRSILLSRNRNRTKSFTEVLEKL